MVQELTESNGHSPFPDSQITRVSPFHTVISSGEWHSGRTQAWSHTALNLGSVGHAHIPAAQLLPGKREILFDSFGGGDPLECLFKPLSLKRIIYISLFSTNFKFRTKKGLIFFPGSRLVKILSISRKHHHF